MKLSEFIAGHVDEIIDEWTTFARTLLPSAKTMSELALRDHVRAILLAIAQEMETEQSEAERSTKSRGEDGTDQPSNAATSHGTLRQVAGFGLVQLVAEFGAMRASVLALWRQSQTRAEGAHAVEEIARFNEGIDQALAESVKSYSEGVDGSRDMFLAVLGHDLRGPLSGIVMSNQLLARPALSESARLQASQRIGRAAQAMGSLITDLLEFTRARLGSGMPITRATCSLRQICEEVLDAVSATHPEQGFALHLEGDPVVQVDALRLQQALSNLLLNAVQHGDLDKPVSLSAWPEGDDMLLKVSNPGAPIPPGALQSIFEPLVQAVDMTLPVQERSKTSMGLGLYIVREIVQGHGGTVTVTSTAADGTTFLVRLPQAAVPSVP